MTHQCVFSLLLVTREILSKSQVFIVLYDLIKGEERKKVSKDKQLKYVRKKYELRT